jgi:inner membrane protein
MQTIGWSHGATFKALGIGFLALLMLIPLMQVRWLISEREGLEVEARLKIAERWGGEQIVGGPVLVVPVRKQVQNEKGWVSSEVRHFVLPEQLGIEGSLATERRRYGIYETPVYTGALKLSGRFRFDTIMSLAAEGSEPLWAQAVLRVPIADVRGIRSISALRIDGRELLFGPGSGSIFGVGATEVAWPIDPQRGAAPIEFSFDTRIAGTATLSFLPLARQTDVSLSGAWPDPGFVGAFLPERHEVGKSGFQAHWQVLDLNRSYGQQGRIDELDASVLRQSAFGVELYQPAGTYQRNERAGKYGVLFVALTFVALFLFDALGRWRVHPVQYLMVGLALCTFYVVLLALSEQIGFGWAYTIAAIAVVGIIAGYAAAAARSRRAGGALGALLGSIYALLYGLVISEQYSLLIGAIALLVAIAMLMYLTRSVDWHAIGIAPVTPPSRMESL